MANQISVDVTNASPMATLSHNNGSLAKMATLDEDDANEIGGLWKPEIPFGNVRSRC